MIVEKKEKVLNTDTLGGWLILIQVFIIVNAITWIGNLQLFYKLLGEKDILIKGKGATDPSLYNVFIYYELAASLIFAFLCFVVFYYFYKRNKNFPLIITIYVIAEVVVEGVSFLLFGSLADNSTLLWQKLAFTAFVAAAISTYVKVSKRVKLTFVH